MMVLTRSRPVIQADFRADAKRRHSSAGTTLPDKITGKGLTLDTSRTGTHYLIHLVHQIQQAA